MTILEVAAVPPSPNVIRRKYKNPHAYKKLRTVWEWELLSAVGPHHRKMLKEQAKKAARIRVQITVHHNGTYDPDNLVGAQKIVLDALVNIRFLAGDSPDKLELLPAVQVKSARKLCKTVVKIGTLE